MPAAVPANAAELAQNPDRLAAAMGVDLNGFMSPEDGLPEPDDGKLRRLIANQLPPPVAADVIDAVRCYRTWFLRLVELLKPLTPRAV